MSNEQIFDNLIEERQKLLDNIRGIFIRAIESNDIDGINNLIYYVNSIAGCTLNQFLHNHLHTIKQYHLFNTKFDFELCDDEKILLQDLLPKIKSLDEKIYILYYE